MIAGQNRYKSTCTSLSEPKIYQDLDTLYLPVNVIYSDVGGNVWEPGVYGWTEVIE